MRTRRRSWIAATVGMLLLLAVVPAVWALGGGGGAREQSPLVIGHRGAAVEVGRECVARDHDFPVDLHGYCVCAFVARTAVGGNIPIAAERRVECARDREGA